MNSGVRKTGGRIVLECLLAVAIAVFAPIAVMSQLMSVRMVMMLPAIGYVFLKNYAGKGVATASSVMMLVASAFMLDVSVMWMMFAMNIIPQVLMQATEKKTFGVRMYANIFGFILGSVISVVVMYFSFGGNMIERYLGGIPEILRTAMTEVPAETAEMFLQMLSGVLNTEIASMDALHLLIEESIQKLIPLYQLNMPGMLISGALLSAVICSWLDGWMKFRKGIRENNVFMPVHEWYMPASATGGLILIFIVSLIMNYTSLQQGPAVFATVYHIAVIAFCIQAFASIRRKAHMMPRRGAGIAFTLGFFVIAALASPFVAIYGLASAILGSGGVLKQRLDAKMGNNNKNDENDEDKDQ